MENNIVVVQENTSVNQSDSGDNRRENGKFKKGFSGNPKGSPYFMKGLARYGVRAEYWLNRLTINELIEMSKNPRKMGKLNAYDGLIICHIAASLTGEAKGPERERLLNRLEGRPKQIIEQHIGPMQPNLTKDYDDPRKAEMDYAAQMQAAMGQAPISPGEDAEPDDAHQEEYGPANSAN